jgi:glycosyltransferase involved in cell wall biosynthesis
VSNSKRIKVLYIQVPPGGGSLIALYELVKHLPPSIEPVVLCYYENNYSKMLESVCKVIYSHTDSNVLKGEKKYSSSKFWGILQVQYRSLKNYFLNSKTKRTALYQLIHKEQPDIIHHNNEILLNQNAIRAGIKAKAVQVVHERSLGGYGTNYINHIADKMLMKKIAARIDITNAVANNFDKLYPSAKNKKIVLHDVVDTKKFFPAPADEHLRNELGISKNDIVITSVGRIIRWKGQHVLIEAMNLLKDKLSNFRVLLVGADDAGIGSVEYKNELQQLAAAYKLTDKIIFTGNRSDIPAIINLSDVIVHSAVKPEPQGLIVIEALLCNKPLIASGSGGSGELVKKYGGNALDTVNAATLASKLEDVLINKNIPAIDSDKLKKDFDALQQLSVLTELYYDVLANKC